MSLTSEKVLPLSTQVAIISELRYLTINNPYMFNAIIVL